METRNVNFKEVNGTIKCTMFIKYHHVTIWIMFTEAGMSEMFIHDTLGKQYRTFEELLSEII